MSIHYKETQYGFEYGAAEITRIWSDKGRVCIGIETPRENLDVYVTRTGMVRVFSHRKGTARAEWKSPHVKGGGE